MHTFTGSESVIHHNSDLSGKVQIVEPRTGTKVEIPAADLLAFVAQCYVAPKLTQSIENATPEQILLHGSPIAQVQMLAALVGELASSVRSMVNEDESYHTWKDLQDLCQRIDRMAGGAK